MDIRISPRAFSSGFDITTPTESFTARRSPFDADILIYNAVRTQIARVAATRFFGNEVNIVISGGGGYQLALHGAFSSNRTCKGEGRTIELQSNKAHWYSATRRFAISEGDKMIAEYATTAFSDDYKLSLIEESDFKLVVCMVIAVAISESSSGPPPM